MKTGIMRKLFGTVLLCAVALMLSGCLLFTSGQSYETIRFNGREYVSCGNTILLDYRLPGMTAWEDLQKSLLTKIDQTNSSDVYEISGVDSSEWIYCHFEPMLGNGPNGVYHATDINMDTVADFKPDSLTVYVLTKPTATGSGSESLYRDTTDPAVIDAVVKAMLESKSLSPGALQEAQRKAWSYDNEQQYRLEFKSTNYPNLLYLYDYTVGTDGICYVLSDRTGYELDSDILRLISFV